MIRRIDSVDDESLRDFTSLTDVALRSSRESAEGLYLAESVKVIERAISVGHTPRSFLLLEEWLPSIQPYLSQFPRTPVHVGAKEQLEQLTGFHMHRGAMASMHRPQPTPPEQLLRTASNIVVLDGLADHTNVGAVFRSVAALGADAVLLSPDCADPLYRRAVRVSMGAVLQVPWARLPDWKNAGPLLREHGYEIIGLDLRDGAQELGSFVSHLPAKVAFVFGSEGQGLSRKALGASSRLVTIPMAGGIDSLNVATAAAIVLWAVQHAKDAGHGDDA